MASFKVSVKDIVEEERAAVAKEFGIPLSKLNLAEKIVLSQAKRGLLPPKVSKPKKACKKPSKGFQKKNVYWKKANNRSKKKLKRK